MNTTRPCSLTYDNSELIKTLIGVWASFVASACFHTFRSQLSFTIRLHTNINPKFPTESFHTIQSHRPLLVEVIVWDGRVSLSKRLSDLRGPFLPRKFVKVALPFPNSSRTQIAEIDH